MQTDIIVLKTAPKTMYQPDELIHQNKMSAASMHMDFRPIPGNIEDRYSTHAFIQQSKLKQDYFHKVF